MNFKIQTYQIKIRISLDNFLKLLIIKILIPIRHKNKEKKLIFRNN
jgi:hypothetical protein